MKKPGVHQQMEVEEKLREECGVFGMYDLDGKDVAASIYYGLFALQHRGQESCGIAVSETNGPKGKVTSYKGMGLVNEVFTGDELERMKGDIGVGFYCRSKYPGECTAIGFKLCKRHACTCS